MKIHQPCYNPLSQSHLLAWDWLICLLAMASLLFLSISSLVQEVIVTGLLLTAIWPYIIDFVVVLLLLPNKTLFLVGYISRCPFMEIDWRLLVSLPALAFKFDLWWIIRVWIFFFLCCLKLSLFILCSSFQDILGCLFYTFYTEYIWSIR